MFENLINLVNKLEDEKKTEFLSEVENLKNNFMPKPKNLDEISSREEFAELKKMFDKGLGSFRTKWEAENLKDKDPNPETKESDNSEFKDALKELTNQINGLKSDSEKQKLNNYLSEKVKDFPKSMQSIIKVTDNMTFKDIDAQVEQLKEVQKDLNKNIDTSPAMGSTIQKNEVMDRWKKMQKVE